MTPAKPSKAAPKPSGRAAAESKRAASIKVLAVVSEIYPLVKTGGLADVAGALPLALRSQNVAVTTLVPGYPAVKAALGSPNEVLAFADLFGGAARVLGARAGGLDIFMLDAPHLFDRPGNPYSGPDGHDWPDNARRFGALSWVGSRIGLGEAPSFVPDIVHVHDWQAGLAPAYLAYDGRPRPGTVLTVHNLAYQGQFPADLLGALKLPSRAFAMDGVENYGAIGFLKAGLQFADRITTVSPTYAAEIQTPEFGCGLDGLLRVRAGVLQGILNGIDVEVWNPQDDARIAANFARTTLAARSPNKAALQKRLGLSPEPERLLHGVVSRLAWQKGLDLLADAMPVLIETGAQLALLGEGDPALERRFTAMAAAHPGRVGCFAGYDEDLAHLMQAGSDVILVPSRFEPCGLTQLCAMRYGAIPVVAKVGGLADTVTDLGEGEATATGMQFSPATREALEGVLRRAASLWDGSKSVPPGTWARLQNNGMGRDVSWGGPAAQYAALYRDLVAAKK